MISPLQALGCRKETTAARIYSTVRGFLFDASAPAVANRGLALTATRHTLNVLIITPPIKE